MEGVPLGSGEEGGVGAGLPGDTRALQRHLCVTQLSRALGLHHALDTDSKLQLIVQLKAHYQHGLQFGKTTTHTNIHTHTYTHTLSHSHSHAHTHTWTSTTQNPLPAQPIFW